MLSNVLVTGGGTGGHVFVGIAVLDEVRRRYPEARTRYLGSSVGHEVHLVPRTGHTSHSMEVLPLRLNGVRGAARALTRVPAAIVSAARILGAERPEVVLGVGGPASGPALIAARGLGLPTLLHEQNAVPGLANRLAGGFVSPILVGLPQVRGRFVARPDVVVTGNPVRDSLARELAARPADRQPRGTPDDPVKVLILGGSDGSTFLNRRMPAVLTRAAALARVSVRVLHQAGSFDCVALAAQYASLGLAAEVPGFVHDIGQSYVDADVAVTLAGAGTLGELALGGVPTMVVPLARSADDHQRENAFHFARHGAIRLVDETAWRDDAVADELAALFTEAPLRAELGARFRALATPAAAAAIVDRLEEVAERYQSKTR